MLEQRSMTDVQFIPIIQQSELPIFLHYVCIDYKDIYILVYMYYLCMSVLYKFGYKLLRLLLAGYIKVTDPCAI